MVNDTPTALETTCRSLNPGVRGAKAGPDAQQTLDSNLRLVADYDFGGTSFKCRLNCGIDFLRHEFSKSGIFEALRS